MTSHTLVVLSPDRLYAAPLAGAPKPEVVTAIELGCDLGAALGPLAVAVDLGAVRGVKLDLLANALAVEYGAGPSDARRLTVVFATPEAADACFSKVWRRVGAGFRLLPHARDSWSAARAPLTLLAGALAVTAALALALSVYEDSASARAAARVNAVERGGAEAARLIPKGPEGPARWLGWRGVCAAGGFVAGGAQVWLYRRLTHPPERLQLVRA